MGGIAVVYDRGSAGPRDILAGLRELRPVLFVVPVNAHTEALADAFAAADGVLALAADLAETARDLAAAGVSGILTFSERMLATTGALADRLGLIGHPPPVIARLTDKVAQRERLHAAGIDSTPYRLIRQPGDWAEAVAAVGLPAVLKPVTGEGSRSTVTATDIDAGRRAVDELFRAGETALIAESLLPGRPDGRVGDYVSVETLCHHGTAHHLAVTGKFPLSPPFRETGQFWPAALDPAEADDVRRLVTSALTALGVRAGVTHTEVKLTPAGPRIIEINGRLGGHILDLGRRAYGFDVIAAAGALALGRKVALPSTPPSQVCFQYMNPAPPGARMLVAVAGAAAVRRVDGIASYHAYVRPSDSLDPVRTQPLDLLCGHAADHEAMFAVLASALQRLAFTFSGAAGEFTVDAAALAPFQLD